MMYILVSEKHGGVYAVNNKDGKRTVQIFEEEDDAVRYYGLLQADNYEDDLEVRECDSDTVAQNCAIYGYNYCFIQPEDIVFPPT
jgi:hypothetical protein